MHAIIYAYTHLHIYVLIRQSMLCVGTENEFVVVVVRAAGYAGPYNMLWTILLCVLLYCLYSFMNVHT